jgi:hypothetical protein
MYAAVHRQYVVDCGEQGVAKFMTDSFAQHVRAADGYSPILTSFRPLSKWEAEDLRLTPYENTTWYRLEGTAIQGRLNDEPSRVVGCV